MAEIPAGCFSASTSSCSTLHRRRSFPTHVPSSVGLGCPLRPRAKPPWDRGPGKSDTMPMASLISYGTSNCSRWPLWWPWSPGGDRPNLIVSAGFEPKSNSGPNAWHIASTLAALVLHASAYRLPKVYIKKCNHHEVICSSL